MPFELDNSLAGVGASRGAGVEGSAKGVDELCGVGTLGVCICIGVAIGVAIEGVAILNPDIIIMIYTRIYSGWFDDIHKLNRFFPFSSFSIKFVFVYDKISFFSIQSQSNEKKKV